MFPAFFNLSRCACASQRSLIITETAVTLHSHSNANFSKHLLLWRLVELWAAIIRIFFFFSVPKSAVSISELVETIEQNFSLESSRGVRRWIFFFFSTSCLRITSKLVWISRKESQVSIIHKTLRTHTKFQHFDSLTFFLKIWHILFSLSLSLLHKALQPGNTLFSQTGAVCWPAAKTEFKKSSRHCSSASCFSCQEHLQLGV